MKFYRSKLFFIFLVTILAIIGLSLTLIFCKAIGKNQTFYSILFEVDKALIVTGAVGIIAKIVSDDMIQVKRNNDKLRKLGVEEITNGMTSNKHRDMLFGGRGFDYPKELKFMFISGNMFMKKYKNNIINSIRHGANVQILVADSFKSKDFLSRGEYLCEQSGSDGSYIDQVNITKEIVKEIKKVIEEEKLSGSIELRHYIDEFRYNYRIGIYGNESDVIKGWVNFSSPIKDSIDLSLGVHGECHKGSSGTGDNLFENITESFNLLWDAYNPLKSSK